MAVVVIDVIVVIVVIVVIDVIFGIVVLECFHCSAKLFANPILYKMGKKVKHNKN